MRIHSLAADSAPINPFWHADLSAVFIRRVQPGDAPALQSMIRNLSQRSRSRRFHAGIRELPASLLDRFTRPDALNELALVATTIEDGNEVCIGEARYALSDDVPEGREFALAVADRWQRLKIGQQLLNALTRHARSSGIASLHGDVMHDNLPMLALAESLGFGRQRHPGDPGLLRVVRRFASQVVDFSCNPLQAFRNAAVAKPREIDITPC